jgi:hypothetical protein
MYLCQQNHGVVVEGRQNIYELNRRLVPNGQSKGTIHILDGSSLQVTWGEGLPPVFGGLDAFHLYGIHFRHRFQLGCHLLQKDEHLHKTDPYTKRRGNPLLLQGLVSVRHPLHQERFLWNELELALFGTPGPCILQHFMG